MKLNTFEFLLMNNPIRTIIQEKYEAKILRQISHISDIGIALEIGCGNGKGTKMIKKLFNPKKIIAIDLDEKMIKIAKDNNKDHSITYQVMDASKLDFPNNYFDAIFDFAVIHHIPNWEDCIKELHRVLKKNGEVIIEDLSTETFAKGIGRFLCKVTDHPYKDMFSSKEFTDLMTKLGFEIRNYKKSNPLGLLEFFSLNAIKKG